MKKVTLMSVVFPLILFCAKGQSTDRDAKRWIEGFDTHVVSDTTTALVFLDSLKTQLIDKTDTATYWTALYYAKLAYKDYRQLRYKKALDLYVKSRSIFKSIDRTKAIAQTDLAIGRIYLNTKKYDSAISISTKVYGQFNEMGDVDLANRALNILFLIYFYLEEYEKAKPYAKTYLDNLILQNDTISVAIANTNLAATFFRLKKYDSSIFYHKKALAIALKNNVKDDIGYSYLNLGEIHSTLFDPDSALYYHRLAQEIFSENGNPAGLIANSLNLGKAYIRKDFLDSAFIYIHESIDLAMRFEDMALLRDGYDVLIEAYELKNDHLNAYKTLILRNEIQDSLSNILKQNQLDDIIIKYEAKEKEQQIALQKAALAEQDAALIQNRVLLFSSILLIGLLLIIGALWRNRVSKKQQLELQAQELKSKEAEINASISSQEKERARYARDLHDGFGQMISILSLNLGSLKENAKPADRQRVFEESEQVISEMYDELKGICFDLMPQTLVKDGLKSGLLEFAERINQTNQVFVETNFFGLDQRLEELQEISLYRISQEWINNILKYSDATKVTLQITKDEEEITLLVEDNGTGFDKSKLVTSKGNGWKNLNTRTKLIHGTLELETTPNQRGNTLIINSPSDVSVADEAKNTKLMV